MGAKPRKVLDLTQPFYHNASFNPDLPMASVELVRQVPNHGYSLEQLSLCTHVGTHMDAPTHVFESGASVDDYPLHRLQGTGIPVDLFTLGADEPITAQVLEPHAARFVPGTIALLCTGWGERRGFTDEYINHSPWLESSGAKWLADRGVHGVAIDHFSIAGRGPAEKVMPAHLILLGAGIWIVEEALLPRALLERAAWHVVALPLRLRGASGAPTRMVAFEMDQDAR